MVPGHDAHERRVYLEDQFAIADQDGNGVVDFSEFVAFYTQALHDSRKSDLVHDAGAARAPSRARAQVRAGGRAQDGARCGHVAAAECSVAACTCGVREHCGGAPRHYEDEMESEGIAAAAAALPGAWFIADGL
jgi:hypothetical protein